MRILTLAACAGITLCLSTVGTAQAGSTVPADISGTKYEDVNGNGIRDMGTDRPWPYPGGVTIQLLDFNGTVIDSQVTDANGDYAFEQLDPGQYRVQENLSFDTLGEIFPTTPTQSSIINLFDGVDITVDFGNTLFGSFHGLKFFDDNGDGVRDPNEAGLDGIEFLLMGTNGMGDFVQQTQTTDADGHFWFDQLLPGNYTISEMLINDLLLTTLPNARDFILMSGQEIVFQPGAAMLPDGSLRTEVAVGDELVWGNAPVPTVPEPALLALLGMGLAGLGVTRRRRQAA